MALAFADFLSILGQIQCGALVDHFIKHSNGGYSHPQLVESLSMGIGP